MNHSHAAAFKARNAMRQMCRTDLLKLCAVLGYKDVTREVHGPIIEALQKFPGGEDVELSPGNFEYRPYKQLWELEGTRRQLILDPRGHLKTTVITIAHAIQFILNYPDIRILISTATGDQAEKVLKEIKAHFQFNEAVRALFPEFCPQGSVVEFGSRDEFTVPCRKLHRKEPTLWTCSVGKVIAGVHPDVIKSTDLVDKENVKTPGAINEVISHFKHLNPLLERYDGRDICGKCGKEYKHKSDLELINLPETVCCGQPARRIPSTTGWNYVEGTRYDFGDLYATLLKSPDWSHQVRAAIDDEGRILWPSRFSRAALEATRREMGDWEFSAQYLNKCVPQGDGLCDPADVAFVPAHVIGQLLPKLRVHVTVDVHGMDVSNRESDYTAMSVGGFDTDGRLYIVDIRLGRFSPEEVINQIFDLHTRYRPVEIKIEKEAHSRVLLPFLQREMSKRQRFPIINPIKRDTHTSKQQRIRGLRPWFKAGIIRFNDDMPLNVKQELLDEIAQFPSQSSGVHDDILDTLADMMQNSEGGVTVDVVADPPDMKFYPFGREKPQDRFMGFDERGVAQWLYGPDPSREDNDRRNMTGIL